MPGDSEVAESQEEDDLNFDLEDSSSDSEQTSVSTVSSHSLFSSYSLPLIADLRFQQQQQQQEEEDGNNNNNREINNSGNTSKSLFLPVFLVVGFVVRMQQIKGTAGGLAYLHRSAKAKVHSVVVSVLLCLCVCLLGKTESRHHAIILCSSDLPRFFSLLLALARLLLGSLQARALVFLS